MASTRTTLLTLALLMAGGSAQAQSTAYGCRGLSASDINIVEGVGGVFLRTLPDLQADTWIAPETVEDIAHLSSVLEAGGTRLVVVPMPTKALAMPDALPLLASHLGYDVDLAASVYDENVRRLRQSGVLAVDGRAALRQLDLGGGAPFHAVDPRPTAAGLRALAAATARVLEDADVTPEVPRRFEATRIDTQPIASAFRTRLQRHCSVDLPPVTAEAWALSETAGDARSLGSDGAVVVGSDMSGDGSVFAGFLSEATGRGVQSLLVEGEDGFAAITSFLTSPAFAVARPGVLIWEFPVWADLGGRGDQPMAELIAAAGQTCTTAIALQPGAVTGRIQASLAGIATGPGTVLMLESGGALPQSASFRFFAADGSQRVKSIHRTSGERPSGRFYLPLSGLWPDGAVGVEIETDAGFGALPGLAACTVPEVTR